jgi:chromosome segregation protein
LAKSEERLDFLTERVRQFEDNLKERQSLLAEHQRRNKLLKERHEGILLAILRIESGLAALYLKKESVTREVADSYLTRHELSSKRATFQTELKRLQHELQKMRSKIHAKQIDLERCLQEQKNLLDRMREDYGIDLNEKAEEILKQNHREEHNDQEIRDSQEEQRLHENEPADYQTEIEDLRTKLARLGSVNLEAIETLEDMETRHITLSNQYNDLISAKKSIEKIIEKINAESQQLFEETFEGVKQHFRDLFQQLFGGGNADLVLEDPANLLESGVDIVAKPPGKKLKSVMLLSGGEKTLTCVALLLAFFRYRPNPVCILDECDAALDEGNIDRFVNVVKAFRTATQFLMITHSKKSMAAATTIYGVTMQESGVSKPVSVRFVDVDENGEIKNAA